jgi:hypothetical protein
MTVPPSFGQVANLGGRHAALEAVTGGVKVPFTGLAK